MTNGRTELEKRIILAESLGQKWAELHAIWLQLDEDKKGYLSALMNDIEAAHGNTISESKLERMARGSKQYRDYIRNMCIARGEELRAKIKYTNALNFFEAGRSAESTAREQMKTLKFIP